MPESKPYQGLSTERLTKAMNDTSNKSFVHGVDFNFGTVTPFSGVGNRNSLVQVIPTNGGQPSYHQYERLSLSILSKLDGTAKPDPVTVPNGSFYARDVLTQINTALGLNLTASEIVNTLYPNDATTFRLTIDKSVAWIPGSYYDFTVTRAG